MKTTFFLLLSFVTISGWSQTTKTTEILQHSEAIDGQRFELKFVFKTLPDNSWYLQLKKDGTYAYIHWSGFDKDAGTVLESGKYVIVENVVQLTPDKSSGELAKTYLLVTTPTHEIADVRRIGSAEANGKTYCLVKR